MRPTRAGGGRDAVASEPGAPARALSRITAVLVAIYVVSVVPGVRHRPGYSGALDGVLETGTWLLLVALILLRTRRAPARVGWVLIGIAFGIETLSQAWYYWVVQWQRPMPHPSVSDIGYVAFYPIGYVGFALVLRQLRGRVSATVWLDGAIAGLTVAALACATVLSPVLVRSRGAVDGVATNLVYPVADVGLLALVGAALVLGGGRGRSLWLILGSLLATGVANTAYLLRESRDSYRPGSWIDAVWTAALLVFALAAPTVGGARSGPAPIPEPFTGPVPETLPDTLPGTLPETLHGPSRQLVAAPVVLVLADVVLLDLHPARAGAHAAAVLASAAIVAALGRLVLTLRDVRQLAETRREARTDELTGLMNRRGFYRQVTAVLERSAPEQRALLLLDLDRFKEVNDSLGHHAGDELLRLVGARLQTALDEQDLIGRLGGDEFAVLLASADEQRALAVAQELRDVLTTPFAIEGIGLKTDASVGIALSPEHGDSISTLLRSADVAMYQAKNSRGGQRVFSVSGDIERELRLRTVVELRTALAHGQLVLHYQPKADLRTGRVTGVEALVRWDHPTRGLLYPAAFLAPVEDAGLMPALTLTVLEMALDQAVAWADAGRGLKIAVNLSASSLVDARLAQQVRGLLADRDLPATALQLEITEDFLLADRDRARLVLSQLRDDGVTIAVDDFGTGYSSLAYLRELPIDELKLDQSFVFPMADDARAAALVQSIVGLAHSLGLRIVAEGVENVTARAELARYGCDEIQGYLLSRPLAAAELEWWLDERGVAPGALTRPPATSAGPPFG